MADRVPKSTSRLAFRAWRDDDFMLLWALLGNPKVTALVGGPFDDAIIRLRLTSEIINQREYGYQYWPIFLHDGTHVGCCGLKPYQEETTIHEFGFYLRPEHWGHGYAFEAGQSVIAFAFDVLGVTALFAGHHPENAASKRALEKLGFRYSHDELYPPTGLMHPGYKLERLQA